MSRPRVVLIAGSGHGGTTILNMVLGQHPSIFATGKLRDFPEGGLFIDENVCSCGKQALSCPFWATVRERFAQTAGQTDRTTALFRIVTEESGREFVGDVTHNVGYAKHLQQTAGIDLYLVHVVRDGRGVVNSRIRKDYRIGVLGDSAWRHFRRVIKVSRRWKWHLRQFGNIEKQLGERAVRISYEELCRDPAVALAPVGACLGLDFSDIGARLGGGEPFEPVPHLIRGNAVLRSRRDVVLRHDARYLREMSRFDRLVWRVASMLA